jgi:hypothetical protein
MQDQSNNSKEIEASTENNILDNYDIDETFNDNALN